MMCCGDCRFCSVQKHIYFNNTDSVEETIKDVVKETEENIVDDTVKEENVSEQADNSMALEVISEPIEYSVKKTFGNKLVGVKK